MALSQNLLIIVALLAMLVAQPVIGQDIPVGVRYSKATPETNKKAESTLRQAFSQGPTKVATIGKGSKHIGPIIGPFLAGQLVKAHLIDISKFQPVIYHIPLSKDVVPKMNGMVVRNDGQRDLLDSALQKFIPFSSAPRIRKLTSEEISIIWFYIGWDLNEPIFAVEQGNRKFIVNFNSDGESLFWIEEISEPCFQFKWEGGGLQDCFCITVGGDEHRIGFTSSKSCE